MKLLTIFLSVLFSIHAFASTPVLVKEIISTGESHPSFASRFTLDAKHIYNFSDTTKKLQVFEIESGKEIFNFDLRSADECRPMPNHSISNQTHIDQKSDLAMIGDCCDQYPNKRSCNYRLIRISDKKEISKIERDANFYDQVTYDPQTNILRSQSVGMFYKEFDFINNSENQFKFASSSESLFIDQTSQVILKLNNTTNKVEIYDFPARNKIGELATKFIDNGYVWISSYRKVANRFLVFTFSTKASSAVKVEIVDIGNGNTTVVDGHDIKFVDTYQGRDDLVISRYLRPQGDVLLQRLDTATGTLIDLIVPKGLYFNDFGPASMILDNNEEKISFTKFSNWNSPYLAGRISLNSGNVEYINTDCLPDSFSRMTPSKDGQHYLCTNEQKTAWWKIW